MNLSQPGEEQRGDGEAGAVGKIVAAFFAARDKKDERGETAENQARDGDGGEAFRTGPKAECGDELDVSAADAAAGQDGQQKEQAAAGKSGEQVIGGRKSGKNRMEQADHGKGEQHPVKDHLLFPIGHSEEEQKKDKEKQQNQAGRRQFRMADDGQSACREKGAAGKAAQNAALVCLLRMAEDRRIAAIAAADPSAARTAEQQGGQA